MALRDQDSRWSPSLRIGPRGSGPQDEKGPDQVQGIEGVEKSTPDDFRV